MLNSCIYEVEVIHQRLAPKKHRFQYDLFMFLLDLDEAAEINKTLKLIAVNKRSLYSFFDEDHFQHSPLATREKIAAFLASRGVTQPIGKIELVTNLRFLGYVFNPISIYFVHDTEGSPLLAVAEVGNTFLERKPYLLPMHRDQLTGKTKYTLTAPKNFYVSPYSRVDDTFEFSFIGPEDTLELHINTKSGGRTTLASSLRGKKLELTDRNVIACTLRYPFVTLGVIGLIHFHALWLWIKKVPYFRKEINSHLQTELIAPRGSLNHSLNSSVECHVQPPSETRQCRASKSSTATQKGTAR
ncbi:MAG: DUF1365 domain-containing protein [Candidatus Melainabacteria bacterium]|nr:DUF1365 domain-containing protein [Candidatus Melainabacteria bacterium]